MKAPKILIGFSEIAADYDAVLCDIWGVLHNGRAPFDGVDDALDLGRGGLARREVRRLQQAGLGDGRAGEQRQGADGELEHA